MASGGGGGSGNLSDGSDVSDIRRIKDDKLSAASMASTGIGLGRFSSFVTNGGENYLLGNIKTQVEETDMIEVVVREMNI